MQDGDTLSSIALSQWGDASYWYMIADANGLSSDSELVGGMDLVIPDKIHDDAIGDVSPTAPHKPKHGGCGVIGQIIEAVVAVVVTIVTGNPVLGNIASQLVGLATGIQSKFNWKSLAIAEISADLGPLLNAAGVVVSTGDAIVDQAANAVINSTVTQGIAVATGLQSRMDWAGVAEAGVSAGVAAGLGQGTSFVNGFAKGIVSGMAGDIAGSAVRSLSNGSDFGDNMLAGLPGVLSQAIYGGAMASGPAALGKSGGANSSGNSDGTGFQGQQNTPVTVGNLPPVSTDGSAQWQDSDGNSMRQGANSPVEQWDPVTGTWGPPTETVVVTETRMTPKEQTDFDWDHFRWWVGVSPRDLAPVSNTGILPWALSQFGRDVDALDSAVGHDLKRTIEDIGNAVQHPIETAKGIVNSATGVVEHPVAFFLRTANSAAAAGLDIAHDFKTALQNGTAQEYISAGVGHAAVFLAAIATDSAELDAVEAGGGAVRTISDIKAISADEANAPFLARGWNAPYSAAAQVRQFTTNVDMTFLRFTTDNPVGQFLARADEVAGMTPEQIQQYLALPEVPTNMLEVTVPAGTRMQVGIVGPQPEFLNAPGGGIQYQLLNRIPGESFGPMRPIIW